MRDIGLGRMFLETDGLALPLNTFVSVEFTLGNLAEEFRLRGLVVRRAAAGVGIMFIEAAAEVVAALSRALYREPRVPAQPSPAALSAEAHAFDRAASTTQALNG